MESGMQGFYKDKIVFITGATGFLGKVIIEKLLRSTDVKRIYILIRGKRGRNIRERILAWEKETLFEGLLQSKPKAFECLMPIVGDCLEPDLGISDTDRRLLSAEVHIVIHGAATVRFNEPLHVALAINTRATRLMVQLAKQMPQLEAFVHVSTAYANCVIDHIEEKFYPENLTCSSEKVLQMSDQLSEELTDNMSPALLGSYPNTYTYTKALAEDVILREGSDLPISIFRPAIIGASHKEPISGWIDNLFGPIGLIYGVAHGVLRIASINKDALSCLVPVDYCANVALAAAWQTSKHRNRLEKAAVPEVYTLAPAAQNPLTNGDFLKYCHSGRDQFPLTTMIWYPFLNYVKTPWLYQLAAFFYHTLPGYVFDLALRLTGRKPRLAEVYRKIHYNMDMLKPFTHRTWQFDTKNTDRMRELMSADERRVYNFDMGALEWKEYFDNALLGMRQYLGTDANTPESIEQAQRLLKRLKMLHHSLQVAVFCVAGLLLWWLLKPFFFSI
ncbi:fatty acyl-CoA reductase wat-like [Drosophila subobscura]|uniref:fatty acyl-CoA reductase wat-like n=1 Tax=Drosophila subobscura TaxID=7241 RepID=UPI00155A1E7A|nr:fatty acyl-CoA reductase wat-like [Drosophila subobscura]